jgi:hypothetical protein
MNSLEILIKIVSDSFELILTIEYNDIYLDFFSFRSDIL